MEIPRSGKVPFRVRTGLNDFQLQVYRAHRRLSLFRRFPTDSGYWSLEEVTRFDMRGNPFSAVIQIEGTHRSSEVATSKLGGVLGRLRGAQDDYPAPAVIRFEIQLEADHPDWFHAQPGADVPWSEGAAECSAYHLRGYFEELLAALEECYSELIEFDMPAASPEEQTVEAVQHSAPLGKQQAGGQGVMPIGGPPEKPDEPSQQEPVDVWLDWYHACKRAGYKVTLRGIGNKIGLSESSMKKKNAVYKAERGLESRPTSSGSGSKSVPK